LSFNQPANGLSLSAVIAFAAPIVSADSAILGSKFNTASSAQIPQQLLNTGHSRAR
jgi:hypothetical protein